VNTTYSDSHGRTIGSSTTTTYPFGQSSTTTRDAYGRTIGTSTSTYWTW